MPFAAGGPADVIGRIIGQQAGVLLGQSFVVENRGGAGGTIGARLAAQAEPDGYTLMFANTSTLSINPAVYRNLDFDPAKAFIPVALVGTTSNLVVVNPALPVKSIAELIAYGKSNPGKLAYSSPGVGTPPHMIGEMLKLRTGLDITHVPYKSGGSSTQDVVSGQVPLTFENPAVSLPLVQAGSIRAIAVTSEARNPRLPEVATVAETIPDFVSVSFTGVVAPAGVSPAIVAKLNAAINESLQVARGDGDARQALGRHQTRHARRIRRLPRQGAREVAGRRQGGAHPDRLILPSFRGACAAPNPSNPDSGAEKPGFGLPACH